jgi:YidC/Oxa1 family membrane protein insertase
MLSIFTREKKPMSMELRLLLAIVLSFGIFFVYQSLFVKKQETHEVAPAHQTVTAERQAVATGKVKVLEQSPSQSPPPVEATEEVREPDQGRTITVSTDLYVATIFEPKAAFNTFQLKAYRETLSPNAPMKGIVQFSDNPDEFSPVVGFSGKGSGLLQRSAFRATGENDTIDASQEAKTVDFSWTSPQGITMIKTYSFSPGSYEIGMEVKVRNLSGRAVEDNLTVSLRKSLKESEASRYTFSGPAAYVDGELLEIERKKIAEQGTHAGRISWVAMEDQYFANAIIPEQDQQANLNVTLGSDDVVQTTYVDPAGPVAPNTERTYQYKLYYGPKSLGALRSVGSNLGKMLDFGFFDVLAKPLLYAMNAIYGFIPNYGIAIIIITLGVKLLFWPLSNKSYESMSQMKKLQPKMAEIREKYKNDKKMMNQELMNLYKVYKVNPLGGCLPMVLQIPVFFAFYKMLYQAIELRHAPFFLWINDLSAPDRLFNFAIDVPLMAPPYGIPVLTLIMGASMFLQQKMSPPPGDPAQAKMMMFMPIFFTFIFINFPSGLVLYWLVNNILSIAQQHYITKKSA